MIPNKVEFIKWFCLYRAWLTFRKSCKQFNKINYQANISITSTGGVFWVARLDRLLDAFMKGAADILLQPLSGLWLHHGFI